MVLFGIIGLLILLAAWGYETYKNIKKRRNMIDLKFAYTYLAGIAMLLVYSLQIGDTIFTILNSILLVVISTEVVTAKVLKYRS